MSWLEYSQCVLEKVSFDHKLFLKELRKLLRWLSKSDRTQLLRWCRQRKHWKMGVKLTLRKRAPLRVPYKQVC